VFTVYSDSKGDEIDSNKKQAAQTHCVSVAEIFFSSFHNKKVLYF